MCLLFIESETKPHQIYPKYSLGKRNHYCQLAHSNFQETKSCIYCPDNQFNIDISNNELQYLYLIQRYKNNNVLEHLTEKCRCFVHILQMVHQIIYNIPLLSLIFILVQAVCCFFTNIQCGTLGALMKNKVYFFVVYEYYQE